MIYLRLFVTVLFVNIVPFFVLPTWTVLVLIQMVLLGFFFGRLISYTILGRSAEALKIQQG